MTEDGIKKTIKITPKTRRERRTIERETTD